MIIKPGTTRIKLILTLLGFIVFCSTGVGQSDSTVLSKVLIENADRSVTEIIDGKSVQYLKGNVRAIQDSIFMFCDSAVLRDNQLLAIGEVIIIQDDSIKVFSDSLLYNGDSKLAKLYNSVVLQNGDKSLFTESMLYMLEKKEAVFHDTCLLVKGNTKLSSLYAHYNVRSELAFFYEEVTIIDEDFQLKSDSLMYDTDIDRAYFIAPSYIQQKTKKIYCEDGFYDIEEKRAFFSKNPKYFDNDQYAEAESMYYSGIDSLTRLSGNAIVKDSISTAQAEYISMDEKTNNILLEKNARYQEKDKLIEGPYILYNQRTKDVLLLGRSRINTDSGKMVGDTIKYLNDVDDGEIIGNAFWTDTLGTKSIKGDLFYYKETDSYFKAVAKNNRPLYKQVIESDTLYFSADTLIRANPGDSINFIEASRYVRIFKSDLQAVCDSLYYSDLDSTFHLHGNPIVWSDSIQFTGDTIQLIMKDDVVSEIVASQQAFIVSNEIEDYFNQIKAKHLHAYLDSGSLRKMELKGNAESLYLIKDSKEEYIGPNHTLCSQMDFYFEDDELEKVEYFTDPESKLVPMDKAGDTDLRLSGFNWLEDERPKNWKMVLKVKRNKAVASKKQELDEFEKEVDKVLRSSGLNEKDKKLKKKR